ncbi:MAG: hypothetical protein OEW95_11695 [Candidatus Bathyarchaeota archaeon]|nr:hypothetical protein [Candidatus Bathyarchaeota archaeon]
MTCDLPQEEANKVNSLLEEFERTFREHVNSQKLNPNFFPIFRFHHIFIGVDASQIHLVYTTEGVSSPVVALTIKDLRTHGILTQEQVCDACVNDLGFKDISMYFSFPIGLLDVDEKSRKLFLEQASNQFIESHMRQIANIEKLGLTEAFRYLQNARQRFHTRTPEGYSNCKTDCRNAILSALSSLSGSDDLRKGVRILGKKGVIGGREEELIIAFENLLVKMKGVLSKKGPHPPMATEKEDAELALGITQALLIYLANRAISS